MSDTLFPLPPQEPESEKLASRGAASPPALLLADCAFSAGPVGRLARTVESARPRPVSAEVGRL
jgi:hypothetical protein